MTVSKMVAIAAENMSLKQQILELQEKQASNVPVEGDEPLTELQSLLASVKQQVQVLEQEKTTLSEQIERSASTEDVLHQTQTDLGIERTRRAATEAELAKMRTDTQTASLGTTSAVEQLKVQLHDEQSRCECVMQVQ